MKKGFLEKYRKGHNNDSIYIPQKYGFLKLEYRPYDTPGILSLVSFVLDDFDDAIAIGMRLEMKLSLDGKEDEVTWISENGISGLQWSDGHVIWGHTYDDDSASSEGRKIALDAWVDECIEKMINPDDEEIEERKKYDAEDVE